VIISEDSRSDTLIKEFSDKSIPRIAISVDMLDTGVDVPEVCNLVFAKPVFSKIKFWQMIGRGTRSEEACKHKEWLPEGGKDYFSIFDFWNNFEYFNMKPDGVEAGPIIPMTGRVFLVRVQQLEHHIRARNEVRTNQIRTLIEETITALPMDSVTVRAANDSIKKVLSGWIWDNVGVDPVSFLKREMMPLMRFAVGTNLSVASFTLKYEKLAYAVLKHNDTEIERLKPDIGDMVARLPMTIDAVKAEEALIKRVLSPSFWVSPEYDEVREVGTRLAPLMKYMQKETFEPIVIRMGDTVEKWVQMQIAEPDIPYVVNYLERVMGRIISLISSVPAIEKIERGEEVTDAEIREIETALNRAGVPVHASFKGRIVDLIKTAIDQDHKRVEASFEKYIREHQGQYTADQISFIRILKINFMKRRHIERGDLFEAPFTNLGLHVPIPMFSEEEIDTLIGLCDGLDIYS
jgi:type I restriction enzyme R subunit